MSAKNGRYWISVQLSLPRFVRREEEEGSHDPHQAANHPHAGRWRGLKKKLVCVGIILSIRRLHEWQRYN